MQKKNSIEKIYKDYLSVKEGNLNKWNKDFFYNLFSKKNIVFISTNNPIEGYLIARKVLDEYEVLSLASDINKRRKGVGTMLFKKLINIAVKNKVKRILLEVSENNYAALCLYKKLGFQKINSRRNYYNEGYKFSDAYIMELG